MALADYHLRYELPFKDVDGNQWLVQILDRDEAGSIERLIGTGDPVEIYYEDDENHEKGIIGSSCSIKIYGQPNINGTSDLSQFFTNDEERFLVKVFWYNTNPDVDRNVLYWTGFLYQDEYIENITSDPYQVDLVAMDRLGSIRLTASDIGYHTDTEVSLMDVLEKFAEVTGLELTIDEETGLTTENGVGAGFLQNQKLSAQTFFLRDREYIEMKRLYDIVNDVLLSLFCRMHQEEGKLVVRSNAYRASEGATFQIPTSAINMNDNLMARHIAPNKVTTHSYGISSRNMFFNGSFERNDSGDTSIIGWSKPAANTLASIEASDEASSVGSVIALKTINNDVSDSSFDNASLNDKLTTLTLLTTTSRDIRQAYTTHQLAARLRFDLLINNTNTDTDYEIRISLERVDENDVTRYYNFGGGIWETDFRYGKFVYQSTGEWENVDLDVKLQTNFSALQDMKDPVTLRIHTMDYNESVVSNVEVFYDNFEFQVYNSSLGVYEGLTKDTNYYNISTVNDTENNTKETQIEMGLGIMGAQPIFGGAVGLDKTFMLEQGIKGQYWNNSTGKSEKVAFENTILAPQPSDFFELPDLVISLRRAFDRLSRKVYAGTLKKPSSGTWSPFRFSDRFNINYNTYPDLELKAFSRFSYNLKANRLDFDAMTLKNQSS